MRHVDSIKVGPPKRASLCPGRGHEFMCRNRDRRDPSVLEPCYVVQTARRTGSSISQGLNDRLSSAHDQPLQGVLGGRFGEGRLGLANDPGDAVSFLECPFDVIEEDTASRLAYVKQPDSRALERRQAWRGLPLDSRRLVQRIDQYRLHNLLRVCAGCASPVLSDSGPASHEQSYSLASMPVARSICEASRIKASPTRLICGATSDHCFSSRASRTPGTVLTP